MVVALGITVATVGFGFAPRPAAAATGAERIGTYNVDLTAQADGTLAVVETIDYDFDSTPDRHGIYRLIPDRARYDKHHDRVRPIKITSVTASDGVSAKRKLSRAGNELKIRIGDPKQVITGEHTYTISYTVRGAIDRYADHDELRWNAVGTEWPVGIDSVTVTLHAPAAIGAVSCFQGYDQSYLACGSAATAHGNDAAFTGTGLGSSQGLMIVASMPPNTFANVGPILAKHWTFDQGFATTAATMSVSFGLLILLVGAIAALVWKVGRDRRFVGSATDLVFGNPTGASEAVRLLQDRTTPVEYTPPDGLRPGQIGTLLDETAGPLDVSATIIDLAVRKYLTIEEVPKEHWFAKADWRLTRLEKNDPLLQYERLLLDSLFAAGDTVLLSSLKAKFHDHLVTVEGAMYDDVVRRGWFLRRPDKVRALWHGLAIAGLVVAGGLTYVIARWTSFGFVGVALFLAALVLLACSHAMPRRTPKGTGTMHRVLGFRRFIAESERDRAKFAEQQQLFSEYLPYAVVFGVVDRWAKTFEGLAAQPDVSWYQSSTPFNAVTFSNSINGFALTTVGTMQSVPAGSGGGGGGVGGGGGGGGGGSW